MATGLRRGNTGATNLIKVLLLERTNYRGRELLRLSRQIRRAIEDEVIGLPGGIAQPPGTPQASGRRRGFLRCGP